MRRLRQAGCVFAEDEAALLISSTTSDQDLEERLARRVRGVPLEHVLGWAELCGLRVAVDEGVFVPRQRTELLARQAAAATPAGATVVELCCGSGAIAAVLAKSVASLELHVVDIDPAAVRCARRNLAGASATAYCGDLFAPLPARLRGQVATVVANVPYVPSDAVALLPREARLHEPHAALDGGRDGLDVARRVAADAAGWLRPGGTALLETSDDQGAPMAAIFETAGLAARVVRDAAIDATVVVATTPPRRSPRRR